jgi:hypothetical protein
VVLVVYLTLEINSENRVGTIVIRIGELLGVVTMILRLHASDA